MLDSSPLAPPASNPLKRSASTASLPTPPRTRRRRRVRLASNNRTDSGSDGAGGNSSDEDTLRVPENLHKKRKISAIPEVEEEDEFWMGADRSNTLSTEASSSAKDRADESPLSSPIPILSRRKQAATSLGSAPVSPPPSRRVTRTVTSKVSDTPVLTTVTESPHVDTPSTASPPVTPDNKLKGKTRRFKPSLMDSPDNPFVDSGAGSDVDEQDSPDFELRTPPAERPTLTYVFRGVKTRFLNPLYDHANNRPLPPDPDSLLPVEHPDYTGDLTCPPKLLFPQARRSHTRAHHKRTPPPKIHDDFSDDETNDLASRLELPHGFDALEGGGLRRSPRIGAKTAGTTGPEL
ncbi:hypothetical protein PLEOSDRAFT_1110937 [Pleurotus ostreatus PC15]|uniref:Uncharacterized protein n=1 Tax=Pleurotus ostreatus (strain PC15) TaxID=1137138 RepID=A0A067P5T8_PLEO1|nr:hypothetical protein PLEOSDRAFT_1110937 [Pleurotus ostreatus PC15]